MGDWSEVNALSTLSMCFSFLRVSISMHFVEKWLERNLVYIFLFPSTGLHIKIAWFAFLLLLEVRHGYRHTMIHEPSTLTTTSWLTIVEHAKCTMRITMAFELLTWIQIQEWAVDRNWQKLKRKIYEKQWNHFNENVEKKSAANVCFLFVSPLQQDHRKIYNIRWYRERNNDSKL